MGVRPRLRRWMVMALPCQRMSMEPDMGLPDQGRYRSLSGSWPWRLRCRVSMP